MLDVNDIVLVSA